MIKYLVKKRLPASDESRQEFLMFRMNNQFNLEGIIWFPNNECISTVHLEAQTLTQQGNEAL